MIKVFAGTFVWPVHVNKSDNRLWCGVKVKLTRDVPVAPFSINPTPTTAPFSRFRDNRSEFRMIDFVRPDASVVGFIVATRDIR